MPEANTGSLSAPALEIRSGANQNAQLKLVDASEDEGATFLIVNNGLASNGVLQIVDTDYATMLSIEDQGTTGDIRVTGNAQFGDETVMLDRSLKIRSALLPCS